MSASRLHIGMILALLLLASGCAQTAGEAVVIEAAVAPTTQPASARTFTTSTGWSVTLTEARAVLGPIYLYEAAPTTLALWERALGVQVAHAHSSATEAATLVEVLDQVPVDLLAASPALIDGLPASTGRVGALEVHLSRPGALRTAAGNTTMPGDSNASVTIAGVAERDGQRVPFRGEVVLPEGSDTSAILNIPASLEITTARATTSRLAVRVDLSRWMQHIDFAALTREDNPADASGVYHLVAGNPATTALEYGVHTVAAYSTAWED